MSPEYKIGINPKTQRGEINIELLPRENSQDLRRAIIVPHAAMAYLNSKHSDSKNLIDATEKLSEILPRDIAEKFLRALAEGIEGTKIVFKKTVSKKTGEEKYRIIKTDFPASS
jgi:hypothetical protein